MIISVKPSGQVSLDEADNFRGFKVVSSLTDKARLSTALGAAGRYDGEHAWIAKSWLIQHGGQDAAWRSEFDKMCAYAQSKGWIEGDSIRAHVETAG